jgi:hypothetical protein
MGAIDSFEGAIGKALRPVSGSEDRIAFRKLNAGSHIPISRTAFLHEGEIVGTYER